MSTILAKPSPNDVAEYVDRDNDTLATEQWFLDTYAGELDDQASRCRTVPYTDALGQALCRRVARAIAMRNLPLGVLMDETGGTRVGSTDPEVRRLEAPYKKLVLG